MSPEKHSSACCPVYRVIDIISKKWSMHIMRALLEEKRLRFSDFQEALPEINARMLSERLSDLEEVGLVMRHVTTTKPTVIEYEITEQGKDLKPVFKAICTWTKKWGKSCSKK